MATTAIWDVKDNLKRVLDYASNSEKTKLDDNNYHYNGLQYAISYTTQDLKTEKQLYVTRINCNLSTAYDEMMITKQGFDKTDGILAYHAYQPFALGEVDAETALQIGIELAQSMWGDLFEVLVSTHLDKAHYHNHFVINSVSFVNGLRYHDNKANYMKIRNLSDDLCRKYLLSVIKYPKHKSMHYAQWYAESQFKPSWRSAIRDDVDYAINHSRNIQQFYKKLKQLGYEIKYGKHVAIRPKGKERFVCLRSLNKYENYTVENISKRINEQSNVQFFSIQKTKSIPHYRYHGNLKNARKLTGFCALYFRYMYMLGVLPYKC